MSGCVNRVAATLKATSLLGPATMCDIVPGRFRPLNWFVALLCALFTFTPDTGADEEPDSRVGRANRWLASVYLENPEADTDGDGVLTVAEAKAFQTKGEQALRRRIDGVAPFDHLPSDLVVERDVSYGRGSDVAHQKLDILYHKDTTRLRPAIVMIHGGGFRTGSKDAFHPLMRDYALEGYVTLSVTYRFVQVAPFPAQIADCKLAIRWLRAHASDFGVDPERIGVTGSSAGGYLAAMLALVNHSAGFDGDGPYSDQSSAVQAAVPLCGAYDLRSDALKRAGMNEAGWAAFLGESPAANPENARKASPVAYVSSDAPPMLIVHAKNDFMAPVIFAEDFAHALEKAGARNELYVIEGSAHGWRLAYEAEVPDQMGAFFARWLKP